MGGGRRAAGSKPPWEGGLTAAGTENQHERPYDDGDTKDSNEPENKYFKKS